MKQLLCSAVEVEAEDCSRATASAWSCAVQHTSQLKECPNRTTAVGMSFVGVELVKCCELLRKSAKLEQQNYAHRFHCSLSALTTRIPLGLGSCNEDCHRYLSDQHLFHEGEPS